VADGLGDPDWADRVVDGRVVADLAVDGPAAVDCLRDWVCPVAVDYHQDSAYPVEDDSRQDWVYPVEDGCYCLLLVFPDCP
jgi:hypothetical protein